MLSAFQPSYLLFDLILPLGPYSVFVFLPDATQLRPRRVLPMILQPGGCDVSSIVCRWPAAG